jgi:hypothetical protein
MDYEKIFKLGIVASILIVACSIFYYLVIYIPGKEKQKLEEQKSVAELQKKEEEYRQESLTVCLYQADLNYSDNWLRECDSQGLLSSVCSKLANETINEYLSENNISTNPSDTNNFNASLDYFSKKSDCSCRLPLTNADRITETQKTEKEQCYRKYK